jgi:hypothetical protein
MAHPPLVRRGRALAALLPLLPLLLLLGGCGSGGGGDTAPAVPILITTGAARTHAVAVAANGVVTDPASGLTCVFPAGAAGTLTLAPITAAPARSLAGGQGYQLRFTQHVPMSLRFPIPAAGEQLGYILTDAGGCYDDIARPGQEWQAVPARIPGDGFVYFDLPQSAIERTRRSTAAEMIDNFWSLTVNPPPNAATLTTYVTEARRALVAALPAAAQTSIIARQIAQPLTIYFRDPQLGSYYYFTSLGANLYLRTDIDIATAYHETAHYMTHLLMSDAQWRVLQGNAPQVHGLGDVFTRTAAIPDDYAYFLQWVMGQPCMNPLDASTLITPAVHPVKVDMPAVEGYVATLLGHLTFTTTPQRDFAKVMSAVPTVGATPGEVATLISNGAPSLNALYPRLVEFVTARGYPLWAVAVLAERCGWSYHGSGTVLDGGKPAVGATVQPVISYVLKGGINSSFTTPAATVGADGRYTLPRAFFGDFTLRVTYNGTTTNVPCYIERTDATSNLIAIKPLDLHPTATPVLHPLTPDTVMPGDTITLTGTGFGAAEPLNGGVTFYVDSSDTTARGTIVRWSETTIHTIVPAQVIRPTSVRVSNGSRSSNAIVIYGGDGKAYLDAIKTFDIIGIRLDRDQLPNFSAIDPRIGWREITLERVSDYTDYADWSWPNFSRTLTWNGASFIGTLYADGSWTEYPYCKKTLTITGTLDPIRWRLMTLKANLYEEDTKSNEILIVTLELQNIEGTSPIGAPWMYFHLGRGIGFESAWEATGQRPIQVVAYHYLRKTRDGITLEESTNIHELSDVSFRSKHGELPTKNHPSLLPGFVRKSVVGQADGSRAMLSQ